MAATCVHSGVSNTMMGTVVNIRMDTINGIFACFDDPDYDGEALWRIVGCIVHYTKDDITSYIKMKQMWDEDTANAIRWFIEIRLIMSLFERRTKIRDYEGCKWCLNEVAKILYYACRGV